MNPKVWKVDVSTDRFGWENYTINGGEIHSDNEREAIKRVIAAAPALLEACELTFAIVIDGHDAALNKAWDAAGEAIRLAKEHHND